MQPCVDWGSQDVTAQGLLLSWMLMGVLSVSLEEGTASPPDGARSSLCLPTSDGCVRVLTRAKPQTIAQDSICPVSCQVQELPGQRRGRTRRGAGKQSEAQGEQRAPQPILHKVQAEVSCLGAERSWGARGSRRPRFIYPKAKQPSLGLKRGPAYPMSTHQPLPAHLGFTPSCLLPGAQSWGAASQDPGGWIRPDWADAKGLE